MNTHPAEKEQVSHDLLSYDSLPRFFIRALPFGELEGGKKDKKFPLHFSDFGKDLLSVWLKLTGEGFLEYSYDPASLRGLDYKGLSTATLLTNSNYIPDVRFESPDRFPLFKLPYILEGKTFNVGGDLNEFIQRPETPKVPFRHRTEVSDFTEKSRLEFLADLVKIVLTTGEPKNSEDEIVLHQKLRAVCLRWFKNVDASTFEASSEFNSFFEKQFIPHLLPELQRIAKNVREGIYDKQTGMRSLKMRAALPSSPLTTSSSTTQEVVPKPKVLESFLDNVTSYPEVELNIPEEVTLFCMMVQESHAKALLVGGAVRDALLNKLDDNNVYLPNDYDIEVFGLSFYDLWNLAKQAFGEGNTENGEKIVQHISYQGKTQGSGLQCLRITVINATSQLSIDIRVGRQLVPSTQNSASLTSTLTEAENPEVSLFEAARVRDLGPNALYYDPLSNEVFDPTDAASQLFTKEFSFIHPLFKNDITRLFRACKLVAFRGFFPDTKTLGVLKDMVVYADKKLLTTTITQLQEEVDKLVHEHRMSEFQIKRWQDFLEKTGLDEYCTRG